MIFFFFHVVDIVIILAAPARGKNLYIYSFFFFFNKQIIPCRLQRDVITDVYIKKNKTNAGF
jgi:hypothetical protein